MHMHAHTCVHRHTGMQNAHKHGHAHVCKDLGGGGAPVLVLCSSSYLPPAKSTQRPTSYLLPLTYLYVPTYCSLLTAHCRPTTYLHPSTYLTYHDSLLTAGLPRPGHGASVEHQLGRRHGERAHRSCRPDRALLDRLRLLPRPRALGETRAGSVIVSTYYTYCELAQWSGINSGRHSECLLCTRHARTMYLLCTGYARTMYLLCTYYVQAAPCSAPSPSSSRGRCGPTP